jgi:hypothetical protein
MFIRLTIGSHVEKIEYPLNLASEGIGGTLDTPFAGQRYSKDLMIATRAGPG